MITIPDKAPQIPSNPAPVPFNYLPPNLFDSGLSWLYFPDYPCLPLELRDRELKKHLLPKEGSIEQMDIKASEV